jgi:hypothetical protein
MTMISSAISKGGQLECLVKSIAVTAIYFIVGVSLAVLTTLASYLTQWLYLHIENQKIGICSNVTAMLLGIGSFVSFCVGAIKLRDVFMPM